MENIRILMEEIHHEHLGRDGDPVRDLPGDAPVVYGGAQVSDPAGAPLWLALFMLAVCIGGGFAVGYAVGTWMGVGG